MENGLEECYFSISISVSIYIYIYISRSVYILSI